ncbi:MFS transporter [Polaromonas eurypsychrophila]|uniref:MFS transporter n=1 Tax=Polaromonas eurypsychrophila TaxID=1614635 RepID=A0A916SQI3_9BURK|nr:MFS transporter [Polaromonas eurypsychrophila]GGB11366.1 MFS transporter [Polaromonas eurypsychrophila]
MTSGSATLPAATRRSILLLSLATFSSMAVQRICDAMLPELSRAFAVSLAQAAQVVSVFAVTYGLAQLVYGPLGDRFSKFGIVTFATLACCAGSLLSVFAASLDVLVLARVLVALAAAAIIPISMAWVGDNIAYELRQETLARVGLGTTLGLVSGQLVGGLVTDALGWRWAFGITTVLFGAVGTLLYADWRRQQATPLAAQAPGEPVLRPGFIAQALLIITGPWSRVVLAVSFAEGAAGFGVLAIWASHLHDALGLSLTASGAIVALFGLGGMLYMTVARHLIRRLGERGLAMAGGALAGVAVIVLGLTPWWVLALPASLLAGFGFFMLHNTLQTNATQMAPGARGTGVSMFAAALFLGQSVGVLLAASLVARLSAGTVIALSGGVLVALGVLFARALRRRDAMMQAA